MVCFTLAGIYFIVWSRDRTTRANLLFSLSAVAAAGFAFGELSMMLAETPGEYGTALKWAHVWSRLWTVSLVGFVRLYLQAGRPWLAWVACGLRTFTLLPNFLVGQNLNYREITALRHIPFLRQSIAVAVGVHSPWMLVGQASTIIVVIFVGDSSITAWRRGDRRKELARAGAIRSHVVIERGGIRFGLFGMMGTDSITWTINPGALTFPDPIETARKIVQQLQAEGADVIVCMSHGGVREPKNGPITEGDDVTLARAVPGIDIIIGGHTHTFMRTPIIVNGTPIVQAGCYGQTVGELVIEMEGRDRKVVSYELLDVDDTIQGDPSLGEEMKAFTAETSRIVFEPRGLRLDEPLAVIDRDWPNTFFDLDASRPLGNVTADAIRSATGADVALNAAGMVRTSLTKGVTGVQTAYDVFLIAPLGIGVVDQSAGGSLVLAYLTGREIKNCLEFLLAGNPNLPGQYFPRVSGMRFRYDLSRPAFDAVIEIELGDLDHGYHFIDISDGGKKLYSVACNLYLGIMLAAISKKTKGALEVASKRKDGTPMGSRVDALPTEQSGPYLLPPKGAIAKDHVVRDSEAAATMEMKEWQAIMNYLKGMPTKNEKGVTVLAMDGRTEENRSINVRSQTVC